MGSLSRFQWGAYRGKGNCCLALHCFHFHALSAAIEIWIDIGISSAPTANTLTQSFCGKLWRGNLRSHFRIIKAITKYM